MIGSITANNPPFLVFSLLISRPLILKLLCCSNSPWGYHPQERCYLTKAGFLKEPSLSFVWFGPCHPLTSLFPTPTSLITIGWYTSACTAYLRPNYTQLLAPRSCFGCYMLPYKEWDEIVKNYCHFCLLQRCTHHFREYIPNPVLCLVRFIELVPSYHNLSIFATNSGISQLGIK